MCTQALVTPSSAARRSMAYRWAVLEWTLPSLCRPSRCSVPSRPAEIAAFHTGDSNIAPLAMAAFTSLAPWAKIRPAPSALWPTSLLPMSSSLGRPTAGPCAASSVYNSPAYKRSSVGVFASVTALLGPGGATPTPSAITSSTGPGRPANEESLRSDNPAVMPPSVRTALLGEPLDQVRRLRRAIA